MTGLVAFGETSLQITPPGSERLETADDVALRADGTESNVAVAAARLGADAVWLSKLPDTPLGKRVVAELHEHGLDTDVVWADGDDGRQGLSFRERARNPRRSVTVEDRENAVAGTATPGELPMGRIQGAEAVFVGGSTPALSPTARDTTESILRAATGTRVLDLDFRSGLWSAESARNSLDGMLDAVDVLVASEPDARTVFDRTGNARELVHAIASARDFERVVVTRGDRGAVAWHDNVVHERDATDTEVVDPDGQHEAFVGGFLQQILVDAPTERALAYGVASAALTRTTPGPITTVSQSEVDRLVDDIDRGDRRR